MSSSDSLNSTPLKPKISMNLSSDIPLSKTPEKYAPQTKRPTDQIKSPPCAAESSEVPDVLPEKYEILCKFFYCLDSAIRLIKLKGSMPTFTNISPKIECLSDRRFSYGQLAQLKHILPEAIEIKRMLIFDEKTSCMKPDLHVSIIFDAIDCGDMSKYESKNLNLRRVFRARLADYLKAHPEGDAIPEDDLLEPFNRSKQNIRLMMVDGCIPWFSDESSTEQQALTEQGKSIQVEAQAQPSNHSKSNSKLVGKTLEDAVSDQQPVAASHLSPLFQKRFSQRATSKAQEAVQKCSMVSLQSSNFQVPVLWADISAFSDEINSAPTQPPTNFSSKPTTSERSPNTCLPETPVKEINPLITNSSSKPNTSETSSNTCLPATPVKEINPLITEDESPTKADIIQSTPAKLASTPARLMTATPTLKPLKRCYMSPDEVSSSPSNKLARRPPRSRSLKFDAPVNEEKLVDEAYEITGKSVYSDKDNVLSILPESLLHSVNNGEREESNGGARSSNLTSKETQCMIGCLPKLFSMIHYLFQSIKRSVITREELIHKIISGHCDIADRGEVEEQLKLLLELAPEWISEKMAFSGDLLVCINKVSSPESIRMRLQEAK